MGRERLEQTFCWKITSELKGFKYRTLQMEKEQIYSSAYQIDSMIRIYELLLELSLQLEEDQLKSCMYCPGLLTFLYEKWLQAHDEQEKGLERFVYRMMTSEKISAA